MAYRILFLILLVGFSTQIEAGFPLPGQNAGPEDAKRLYSEQKKAKARIIKELKEEQEAEEKLRQVGVVKRQRTEPMPEVLPVAPGMPAVSEKAGETSTETKPEYTKDQERIRREPVHPVSIQREEVAPLAEVAPPAADKGQMALSKEEGSEPISTSARPEQTMPESSPVRSNTALIIVVIILIVTTIYLIRSLGKMRIKQ